MNSPLAGVTFFMTISRLELKTYMRRQRSFRSHIPNPQVKNTVTFKTLTYEIFLLGMLSTLFLLSHDTDNVSESNNTYILIVLNLINIVSNIFLLTYLITNHEAFEYTKKKYAQYYCKTFGSNSAKGFFRRNGNTTSAINQIPNSIQIFTIRTPRITDSGAKRESLVKFNNDIELIELESCSHSQWEDHNVIQLSFQYRLNFAFHWLYKVLVDWVDVFVLNINLKEIECIIKIVIKRCKLNHIVLRQPRQELKINLDTGLGILFVLPTFRLYHLI